MKIVFAFSVVLICIFSGFFVGCKITKDKAPHFRNKMIESELLLKLTNQFLQEPEAFKSRWGKYKHGSMYLIPPEALKEESLIDATYAQGKSSFYGFEFHFDSEGRVKKIAKHKP